MKKKKFDENLTDGKYCIPSPPCKRLSDDGHPISNIKKICIDKGKNLNYIH
jgi:hypothetical protein